MNYGEGMVGDGVLDRRESAAPPHLQFHAPPWLASDASLERPEPFDDHRPFEVAVFSLAYCGQHPLELV